MERAFHGASKPKDGLYMSSLHERGDPDEPVPMSKKV